MKEVSILPGIHSDHSLLYININSGNDTKRGKGFWKWNSDLVHDPEYVNSIKQLIQQKRLEYSDLEDLSTKWELIKLAVRNFTIPYCSRKKKMNIQREKDLNEEYFRLFNIVHTRDHVTDSVRPMASLLPLNRKLLRKTLAHGKYTAPSENFLHFNQFFTHQI